MARNSGIPNIKKKNAITLIIKSIFGIEWHRIRGFPVFKKEIVITLGLS